MSLKGFPFSARAWVALVASSRPRIGPLTVGRARPFRCKSWTRAESTRVRLDLFQLGDGTI